MADPGLAAGHWCPVPVSAVAQASSRIKALLPASGWQVSFRLQADGRTVLEVTDETGSLVRPMASTRLPIVSIDAGWCGFARAAGGARRRWALAVGHVPAGDSQPAVTFTRGLPGAKRARSAMAQPDPLGWAMGRRGRAVGRRRRALHGGPLDRGVHSTGAAPDTGQAAAGTVMSCGRGRELRRPRNAHASKT